MRQRGKARTQYSRLAKPHVTADTVTTHTGAVPYGISIHQTKFSSGVIKEKITHDVLEG